MRIILIKTKSPHRLTNEESSKLVKSTFRQFLTFECRLVCNELFIKNRYKLQN